MTVKEIEKVVQVQGARIDAMERVIAGLLMESKTAKQDPSAVVSVVEEGGMEWPPRKS